MKVNIVIQDDAELRKAVRDLIEGQVRSILRKGIAELVAETLAGAGKKLTADKLEASINQFVKDNIKSAVHSSTWREDYEKLNNIITVQAYHVIQERLSNVDERIQTLIEREVAQRFDNVLAKIVDQRVDAALARAIQNAFTPEPKKAGGKQ